MTDANPTDQPQDEPVNNPPVESNPAVPVVVSTDAENVQVNQENGSQNTGTPTEPSEPAENGQETPQEPSGDDESKPEEENPS